MTLCVIRLQNAALFRQVRRLPSSHEEWMQSRRRRQPGKDYKAHNAMRVKSVVDHFERVMKQRRYFRFCSRWHMTIAKYSSTLKMKTGTENKGDISWVSVRPFENRRCNPFRDSVYWLKLASNERFHLARCMQGSSQFHIVSSPGCGANLIQQKGLLITTVQREVHKS